MFACEVELALWYRGGLPKAGKKSFVYGKAKKEDKTTVGYRILTSCGGRGDMKCLLNA